MLRLALDTSTLTASVALLDGEVVRSARHEPTPKGHGGSLLGLVDAVLREGGRSLADLDALVVGVGPGSFTGLRIGVAVAKGLQVARDVPLVGVSSLEALVPRDVSDGVRVLAALDARRDEVYAAGYVREGSVLRAWLAPCHAKPERVGEALASLCAGERVVLVGDLGDALRARLAGAAGACAVDVTRGPETPRAEDLVRRVLEGGGVRDEGALEPMYLRASDAVLPATRQAV